jgi:hypothetical protein
LATDTPRSIAEGAPLQREIDRSGIIVVHRKGVVQHFQARGCREGVLGAPAERARGRDA